MFRHVDAGLDVLEVADDGEDHHHRSAGTASRLPPDTVAFCLIESYNALHLFKQQHFLSM
ncbi:hypothetical protein D0T26_22505 [Duganella sp. BJB489]|nr:hypothetical protein D0T26_22505 [Duganella sp. BJB489]